MAFSTRKVRAAFLTALYFHRELLMESLLESEGDARANARVLAPLFLAGEWIAIAERNVIDLDQSNRKVMPDLDVDAAAGAQREVSI